MFGLSAGSALLLLGRLSTEAHRRMFVLASLWISTLVALGAGRGPAALEIAPGSPLLLDDSTVFGIACSMAPDDPIAPGPRSRR